jgi:hypothetical protein
MQPTPAGASPEADFGSVTIVTTQLNERYQKLLRLRAVKRQLAELTDEQYQLEWQLFGEGVQ